MKRLSLQEKACKVIGVLVSNDLAAMCEFAVAMKRPITPKDVKLLSDKITAIYTIVHAIDEKYVCYSVPDDWRQHGVW